MQKSHILFVAFFMFDSYYSLKRVVLHPTV